jgi:hypothetical protein
MHADACKWAALRARRNGVTAFIKKSIPSLWNISCRAFQLEGRYLLSCRHQLQIHGFLLRLRRFAAEGLCVRETERQREPQRGREGLGSRDGDKEIGWEARRERHKERGWGGG